MPCPSIGPKWFLTFKIVLVGSILLWSGPYHFGQVQIRLFWTNFYNLDLSKMVGTRPKLFGPIEGQVTNGCIRDPFIIGNFFFFFTKQLFAIFRSSKLMTKTFTFVSIGMSNPNSSRLTSPKGNCPKRTKLINSLSNIAKRSQLSKVWPILS